MTHKCIAIATFDKDFVNPAKVFIHTFKYNHPDIPINMYILDDYTPDQNMLNLYPDVTFKHIKNDRVKQFLTENKNEINTTSFDGNMYDSSKLICMFSYLEAIDELITENKYDVIIKSDLDVVWIDSIYDELNKFVDSNLPIAMPREWVSIIQYEAGDKLLHYPHLANGGYFCAGITLYNTHILNNSVLDTIFNTMKSYGINRFVYLDQDALGLSYKNKFVLNGAYNHTSMPIPKGKDVYVIHYNLVAKPFGKITRETVFFHPLARTYKLYEQIAETINCDTEFITLLKNNLQKLSELIEPYYTVSPVLQILNIKLTNMLKGLKHRE